MRDQVRLVVTGVALCIVNVACAVGQRTDGTAMLAPPQLSQEERVANIQECASQASSQAHWMADLSELEKAPLGKRSTIKFFRHGTPVVNRESSPSMWESLIGPPGGYTSSEVSDRYVLCLLSRGYAWPNPLAIK